MAGEWRTHRLGDLVEIFDGPHATPAKASSGPIFLGISNLAGGRLDLSTTEHLSEEDFVRWTRRVTPQPGDVVFSYETRLGEASLIPQGLRCCLGRRMGLLRPKGQGVDSRFLVYVYLGHEFQETLRQRTVPGSTVDRIPLIEMSDFPIRIPTLLEQRAIAHILGTLDDKIEVNWRMNETLEAMARAIFKSWFVDSDPARVKASDLIRDGILEIGDGYRAKNCELGETGVPFIRAANLNNGFDTDGAARLCEKSVRKAGSKISRVGDVAFTSKGTIGRFARVSEHGNSFVYSPQVCYWRSLDPKRLHPAVLYCWMQTDDFRTQIQAVAGQTDMAPYVSLQDQRQMWVPMCSEGQFDLGRRIEGLLVRQSIGTAESGSLAGLRNALLPKLVSGGLQVGDAGRFLGEPCVRTDAHTSVVSPARGVGPA